MAQSRQSARLSLQSCELGPPTPSPVGEWCFPPPLVPGGRGYTRLRERGWVDPIRKRGQTLWYSTVSGKVIFYLFTAPGVNEHAPEQRRDGQLQRHPLRPGPHLTQYHDRNGYSTPWMDTVLGSIPASPTQWNLRGGRWSSVEYST